MTNYLTLLVWQLGGSFSDPKSQVSVAFYYSP